MIDLRTVNRIKTFGNSMYPLLHDGDVVHYKKINYADIVMNDILVVQTGDRAVTHRVVYKTKQHLITKGDNTLRSDDPVLKKNIIGKVQSIDRNGKKIDPEHIYLFQSAQYFKEITTINSQLQKLKVDFVFLKGLPLHLYYEKAHPRRIYADCDLLIDQNDFAQAIKIFEKNGYKKGETDLLLKDIKQTEPIVETSYYKLVNGFPVIFDLHIQPAFLMTQADVSDVFYDKTLLHEMTQDFLKQKRHVQIEHNSYPMLAPIHLVVYLALHFFHHNHRGIFRLHFLNSIVAIEQKKQKNLNADIQRFTQQYRVTNLVAPVFHLMAHYYSSTIVQLKNNNYISNNLYSSLEKNIFDEEGRVTGGIHRVWLLLLLGPRPFLYKIMKMATNTQLRALSLEILKRMLRSNK